jgi:hypothetical protein
VGNAYLHILAPHFNRIKQSLPASVDQADARKGTGSGV